jgi:hypothetical protein
MTMPSWREFERLVALIEHALAGEGVTVKSPDFIPSITTGTPREVDASLRTRVGSVEILVTIECRNRAATQDVTWIEQLSSKKKNIGAARTIAVAASAFSAEAKRIARENGIDLRILNEITEDDVKSWMPLIGLVHVFKDCELTGPPEIGFMAEPGDRLQELTVPNRMSTPLFRTRNNQMLSLNDLWLRADEKLDIFNSVPKDGSERFVMLTITPSDTLRFCTPDHNLSVKSIILPLRLRWRREEIPLSAARIANYRPSDVLGTLSEQFVVQFETKEASSNNIKIYFQLEKDVQQFSVSAEIAKNEPTA